MNEPRGLVDFYNYYGIPYDATIEEIESILNYEMKEALSSEDKRMVGVAAEYLLNPKTKTSYDAYLRRHKFDKDVRKAEQKRKRVFKLVKKVILIGTLVAVGVTGVSHVKGAEEDNLNNNVCIEYNVQKGDSYEFLEDNFEDYSIVDTEVTGSYRDIDYVYEGDVVVGRTTKEIAEKLVSEGKATIITVEEAVEKLDANGSLKGEFLDFAKGNTDFVFFVPTGRNI